MKIIPTSYTFDASAKTITCADFSAIEKLALITNITTGDIIYQFNSANKGGTLAGTTLTLTYDTTAMSDTDDLQIIIHDTTQLATAEGQEMTALLKAILGALQYSRNADMTNNSDRVTIVGGAVSLNTNQTLTTLTNLQQMNGVQSELVPRMAEYQAWNLNCRSTIS